MGNGGNQFGEGKFSRNDQHQRENSFQEISGGNNNNNLNDSNNITNIIDITVDIIEIISKTKPSFPVVAASDVRPPRI